MNNPTVYEVIMTNQIEHNQTAWNGWSGNTPGSKKHVGKVTA